MRNYFNMIDYDLHVHTEYCGHAPGMSVEALIRAAEAKRLRTVAIASHVFNEGNLELIGRITDEAAKISTDVEIIVGAEVDADGLASDGSLVTDNLNGIPYIIGSIHYIPGTGVYPKSPEDNPLGGEEFFDKWASTLLGLAGNPVLDVLGHPGRLFAAACDVDIYFDDMIAVMRQAAEMSKGNNIAWEINELNSRKIPPKYLEQWTETIRVAVEAGVKIVYGSDAHKPEDVGVTDYTKTVIADLPGLKLETPESLNIRR